MFPSLTSLCRAGAGAFFAWAACLSCPPAASGAIPATNDICATATIIPAAGPFPFLTAVTDVSCATTNGDPFLPDTCLGNSNVVRSVWFKFTPAASALYTLSLGPDAATDFGDRNNDTVLAIYSAPGGCGGPFTLVLCGDDTEGWTFPLVTALSTNLNAGTTYYIVAWVGPVSAAANTVQPMNLQLRVTKPIVPANDNCAGAVVIPAGGPFPYLTSVSDNTLATDAANEDDLLACAGIRGIWFRFTPTASGTYIFSTDTETATTVGYTSIAIFTGISCSALAEVSCVNNYDIPGSRPRATITNAITAGAARYILVWDADLDAIPGEPILGETSVQLRVSVAGSPTVASLAASSITSTSAVLNMNISPNLYSSRYFFEWGPTASYGTMTPNLSISTSLTLPQVKSATILNLTHGLTYHYRAVGSNSQGKVFGLDRTFVASTNQPVLTGLTLCSGETFRFQFTGNAGQLYAVQGSANLTNWVELGGANDLGTNGFNFIHTPGSNPPYRFYKVRVR